MGQDENIIPQDGVITKILSGSMFRVKLENDYEILGILSGRMRQYSIRLAIGDKVRIEMSAYDLTKGRIVYRHKDQ